MLQGHAITYIYIVSHALTCEDSILVPSVPCCYPRFKVVSLPANCCLQLRLGVIENRNRSWRIAHDKPYSTYQDIIRRLQTSTPLVSLLNINIPTVRRRRIQRQTETIGDRMATEFLQ